LIVQEGAFFDGNSKMAVPSANQDHGVAANPRTRASEASATA